VKPLFSKNGINIFYSDETTAGSMPVEYVAGKAEHNFDDNSLAMIKFQTTGLSAGRDGLTNEDVVEILIHRLSCLQQGTAKHLENDLALNHLRLALTHMQMREQKLAERHVCKCAGKK
jgi:hypothetical protein